VGADDAADLAGFRDILVDPAHAGLGDAQHATRGILVGRHAPAETEIGLSDREEGPDNALELESMKFPSADQHE
jgi:hypothetical protein